MKKIKYILTLIALSCIVVSCEDDEPITAGEGNPLNEEVINIEAVVSAEFDVVGEGINFDYTVTIPSALPSDADITVELELSNGRITTSRVEFAAGATTGTETITVAAEDDFITGDAVEGTPNSAVLKVTGVLLDPLVTGTAYTISSNDLSLGMYSIVPEPNPAGLEILMDWPEAGVNDIDLGLFTGAGSFLRASETGSRYESITVENTEPDGTYLLASVAFTAPPVGGLPLKFFFVTPEGDLEVFDVDYPEAGGLVLSLSFDKVTDVDTGITSYGNFTIL